MSKRKIKESKEKIYSLAQLAINKIYENKNIIDQIFLYENQIKLIKELFNKFSSLDNDKNTKLKFILEEINKILNILKSSNTKLKEEKNKISKKFDTYEDEIFNENSTLRQNLKQEKIDNFLLESQIIEKNSEIKKLKDILKELERNKFYPHDKKEKIIKKDESLYYLDIDLESSSKYLNKELLYFNLNKTQIIKDNSKIKTLSTKTQLLKEIIGLFLKIMNNNHSKKYKEDEQDENNNKLKEYLDINAQKSERQKLESKINILTVSELFDVNYNEGKNEEIIDEELHSDDEVIFEPKIKQLNKISKNENLKKIKEQVPGVDLSLISFNKQKVMNEGDLYSFENRKFQAQDIDEQINEMKFKNKEILHKLKVNAKKLAAMNNFIKDIEKNYKLYQKIKLKTSVGVFNLLGNKDFNNKEIGDSLNKIEEDENENETNNEERGDDLVDDDSLIGENIDYTQRSFSGRKKAKSNKKKKINNYSLKKKGKRKKKNIKRKVKRAKSK